jgi:predicted dehydrogenase
MPQREPMQRVQPSQPVRVGLLGAGRQGRNHARVFSTLRHADLVGIYDPDVQAACDVAARYETACFSELDALLDSVDAVSIATPTPFHHDLVRDCLARGLDVLVEKPFTTTVAEAEELARLAAASDRIVQVGHIERFNPAFTQLRSVNAGMTPLVINFKRLSCYVGSNTDVDVVLDLMIHDLDLAMDLAGGMPERVEATGFTAYSGAIDHAVVQLQFPSWPMISITASRVTENKIRSIDVTALEAYAECDLMNKSLSIHHRTVGEYVQRVHGGGGYRQESFVERIHVPTAEPLFLQLEDFLDCVRSRRSPLVTAEHGLATLRLAEEIRRLIHSRMADARPLEPRSSVVPVSLPGVDGEQTTGARPVLMATTLTGDD